MHGTVATIENMAATPAAVLDYLRKHNLPAQVTLAPDPSLDTAGWEKSKLLETRRGKPDPEDQVSVTSALAGVAETGTLIAISGVDHPSTLNFLPETHIVVFASKPHCKEL